MIAYMLTKPAVTVPTEPIQPIEPDKPVAVGAKVGMLKIESGLSGTEKNALAWFSQKYGADHVITSLDNISDYKALWVMIDRQGLAQGVSNLPLSQDQISVLRAWVKSGGNLLVTNHATHYFRANGKKYMIVGSGLNNVGATTLFEYNGSSWNFKGTFFKGTNKAEHGTYWEMPTITKMDDEGNYLFTYTPQGTSVGVKVICWIGKINNDGTFNPLTGPFDFEMAGTSKDGIGLLSPSICQKDGKTICLGIVPDKMARNIMLLVK